jgi:hypothetical protein
MDNFKEYRRYIREQGKILAIDSELSEKEWEEQKRQLKKEIKRLKELRDQVLEKTMADEETLIFWNRHFANTEELDKAIATYKSYLDKMESV